MAKCDMKVADLGTADNLRGDIIETVWFKLKDGTHLKAECIVPQEGEGLWFIPFDVSASQRRQAATIIKMMETLRYTYDVKSDWVDEPD